MRFWHLVLHLVFCRCSVLLAGDCCQECKAAWPAAGAMGVRTAHQVDAKAQLVVATSGCKSNSISDDGEDSAALDAMRQGNSTEPSELKGLSAESDVLSAPRLEDESGDPAGAALGGLQQAVLLCWAQQVRRGTSADELQVRAVSGIVAHCGL